MSSAESVSKSDYNLACASVPIATRLSVLTITCGSPCRFGDTYLRFLYHSRGCSIGLVPEARVAVFVQLSYETLVGPLSFLVAFV